MTIPLRAVFLDAGGTLIHMDAPYILEALAQQGLVRSAADYQRADLAARRAVTAWLRAGNFADDRTRWRRFAQVLLADLGCDEATAAGVREAVARHHAEARLWSMVYPGTREAIAALRERGLIVGIVSNADGRVEQFLEYAGLRDLLDFVVDSGIVGIEKPDPGIFAIACERAGVTPDAAVHVGDVYEVDVVGARRAGVTPILYDPDGLRADADCARLTDMAALPDFLMQEVTV